MKNYLSIILLFVCLAVSCKKDKDPVPEPDPDENESELITTLKLTFTDSAGAAPTVTATFKDPDGDGGAGPTLFEEILLKPGKTYMTTVTLLNESVSPAVNMSDEVSAEKNDHQLFFKPNATNLIITYADQDSNNPPLPVGLSTKWKTTSAGNGIVKVTLKHQPGMKNGTDVPGETDVEVTFQYKVQ